MNRGHQLLSLRLLILLTVTAAIFLLISTGVDARIPEPVPQVHRVVAGDTLWEIASDLGTGTDLRRVISEIQELNGLRTANIHPGQLLVLPSSGL